MVKNTLDIQTCVGIFLQSFLYEIFGIIADRNLCWKKQLIRQTAQIVFKGVDNLLLKGWKPE